MSTQIGNVALQLYDTLKELYEQIDHDENPQLKDGEFMYFEIRYSAVIQEKIRKALHDYESCVSIYK